MNVKAVKRTEPRFDVPSISNLGIQAWGHNNLYPQELLSLVAASESASSCMDRYITFVQGDGFKVVDFSETVVNRAGETADDIVQQLANDVANFRGFALHVNYNIFGNIVEVTHIPFENCRLSETDDTGFVSKIAVHPDWSGRLKRNGKTVRVSKENIDYIDIYNPIKEVIFSQITKAGGIENYKGQVLWVSEAGKQTYPKAVHDSVVSQMSTEEGLGNISNRNARSGIYPGKILVTKKGQDVPKKEDSEGSNWQSGDDGINEWLSNLQGDTNSSKVGRMSIEFDEEVPTILDLQGNNYDKDFAITTETASRKIYAAFNQEVWYKVMSSSFGFSQQIMNDAYEYYSTVTSKERRMIERAFDKIFKHWNGTPNPSFDFTVQSLKYVASKTDANTLTSLYEKNMIPLNDVLIPLGFAERKDGDKYLSDIESTPLAVKLGVGGTQALQGIIMDASIPMRQKVAIFEEVFGIDHDIALKLVYGDTLNNAG